MAENSKKQTQFGVFQCQTGSYSFGGFRFQPGKPVEVPADVAEKLDPETTPVRFFSTAEKAAEEVAKLKEKFARKTKPKS